ncbi:hypothetical protein [Micromonospora pisi]|uniref:hypothetical protein n=1 Tax=Micromonospora pisi TaxID=589240 RepID=UPI0011C4587E|nr:hypothetical protein [Micromonospora pisi]
MDEVAGGGFEPLAVAEFNGVDPASAECVGAVIQEFAVGACVFAVGAAAESVAAVADGQTSFDNQSRRMIPCIPRVLLWHLWNPFILRKLAQTTVGSQASSEVLTLVAFRRGALRDHFS